MKHLIENWKKYLAESSLSRVYLHMVDHETAGISASRGNLSKEENKERTRDLKAALLSLNYGVTRIDGSYIEDFGITGKEKEVKEDSFFVVNLNDEPDFFNLVSALGRRFEQDSVLLIPRGAKGAYLHGTNESDFPGMGKNVAVGDFKGGEEAEFMSRVKGRPFVFGEASKLEIIKDHSRNARWAMRTIADKIINELDGQ